MGKKLRFLVVMMFLGLVISLGPVNVFAKTAIEAQADKMTTQFTNAGNYYGYTITQKVISKTSTKIVKRLDCDCGRYLWNNVQQITRKTTWSGYVTKFKYGKHEYSLNDWKNLFAGYPGYASAIKKVTQKRVTTVGDKIIKYARQRGWTILASKATTKISNGICTSTASVTVRKGVRAYKNEVTVTRKGGKFVYTYKRAGAKVSSLEQIYDWLQRLA